MKPLNFLSGTAHLVDVFEFSPELVSEDDRAPFHTTHRRNCACYDRASLICDSFSGGIIGAWGTKWWSGGAANRMPIMNTPSGEPLAVRGTQWCPGGDNDDNELPIIPVLS